MKVAFHKGGNLIGDRIIKWWGAGDKYWCSEWVAEALGLREPWRYGPNGLHAALSCLSPENK